MISGKQAVALCAALALVWGCGQRQGEKGRRVAFERTEELSATDSVPIGQYGIYSPNRAFYSGDSVWIEVSDKSDFKVFVLSDDGRLLAKGISEGKGRGEVLGVTSMHRIGDRTLVYDSNKGVLSKMINNVLVQEADIAGELATAQAEALDIIKNFLNQE